MLVHQRHRRFYVPVALLVGGFALSICLFLGGVVGAAQGIALTSVVGALVIYALSGRSGDVGAVLGSDRDERQAQLDIRARAITAVVLFAVCGLLAAHEFLQGGRGQPYFDLCILAGVTYLGALVWLKRRW